MSELDGFETRFAVAYRRYLDEAPTDVDPASVARTVAAAQVRARSLAWPWALRPAPELAWLVRLALLLASLSAALLFVGSQQQRQLPAVMPAFACPPGSTPDAPGPVDQARPPSGSAMAFDRAFGKIVLVGLPEGGGAVETWTFDVCTNTWTRMRPASEPYFGFMGMLAYDTAARQTISVFPARQAWAYDLASDTWTMRADALNVRGVRLAYDSAVARVVALQVGSPHRMWSFDGVADAWEPVEQDQDVWPVPSDSTDPQPLLAYDASVDRLVSYYQGDVRLFDLRTGTWSPPGTTSPPFGYGGGYYSLGGEIAYDEAAQRTVLFNMGYVIAYDAAADRWETLYGPAVDGCGVRPECRNLHSMVYDPVNERLVVYGGHVHTGAVDPGWWGPSDDVLAFDTRTREWTVLLEASQPVSPVVSSSPGP